MAKRKLTNNEILQVVRISGFCDHLKSVMEVERLTEDELKEAGHNYLDNYISHLESKLDSAEVRSDPNEASRTKFYLTALNTINQSEMDKIAFQEELVANLK